MKVVSNWFSWVAVILLLSFDNAVQAKFTADYRDALAKSLLFLEAQRSGVLPTNQRVTWRGNSGLKDGATQGVDLVGGYYDAGDNVKFGLPLAFTVTMLSWSVVEYERQLSAAEQLKYALDAIKWGTDYLIKAHPEPDVLWGQVGDGDSDHECWQRPEDMTTSREGHKIDANNPGSDLAGETAAAMAAASMAFRNHNGPYSSTLLKHAIQLFDFADKYRGKYDSSIASVAKFYKSESGYEDELLWAAGWLFRATGLESYLQYVVNNAMSLGGTDWAIQEFSWDMKYAGVQVLMAKVLSEGKGGQYTSTLEKYQEKAEYFLCSCMQKNSGYNVRLTEGGMLYVRNWDNMQYVSSAAFLLVVYADSLRKTKKPLQCPSESVTPQQMLRFAKSQADYMLGKNPMDMSYLVGYGKNYPQKVHHRAASIVSYKKDPTFIECTEGYTDWFNRDAPNPNLLVGALVGGPDLNDKYDDRRNNYEQSETPTYNNAPLVGLFARLHWYQAARHAAKNVPQAFPLSPPASTEAESGDDDIGKDSRCGQIQVVKSIRSTWRFQGIKYYHVRATVFNTNKNKTFSHLVIKINDLRGQLWGLKPVPGEPNTFTLPAMVKKLGPREEFHFLYNQPSHPATIAVKTCN